MLTRESLGLIYDELDKSDQIVTIFTGLVPSHPIGPVYKTSFIDRLMFLVDLGYRNIWVCEWAAKIGSLECLVYAHDPPDGGSICPWNEVICACAAGVGSLECLEYAHTHGCPWDERTCDWAANSGSLECLKYAHEHGCPWDEWACIYSAGGGSLECLEYAHTHGCPWDERIYKNTESLECLEYARIHNCPQ